MIPMEPRTLILNAWLQPHGISTWQNAIVLLFTEKADVIENYEATVSSPSLTLQIPAVMRLRKEVAMYKKGVKFSRINVLTRDGFRCCYCGLPKQARELNYDHVVPRQHGGKTTWENIVSSCKPCNARKRNRTPQQAGMRMHFQPHRPRTLPMTLPLLVDASKVPEVWRPYLGALAQTA